MGKIGEQLFFKLRPIASGNHRYFDDREKVMQQPDISASRGDLLPASVPSRSNTMSFFTMPSTVMKSCDLNRFELRPMRSFLPFG
jgi:hypothetical protein